MVIFLSVMYYSNNPSRSAAVGLKCGMEIFLCSAQKIVHICYLEPLSWPYTLANPNHSNNGYSSSAAGKTFALRINIAFSYAYKRMQVFFKILVVTLLAFCVGHV